MSPLVLHRLVQSDLLNPTFWMTLETYMKAYVKSPETSKLDFLLLWPWLYYVLLDFTCL